MNDTHQHKLAAYVRDEMLPESPPPTREAGVVKWMRENLFSSIPNAILTVISAAFILYVVGFVLDWALHYSWTANSLSECRDQIKEAYGEGQHGACWAVIRDRFLQLIYGFYPPEYYWRINLAFVLMLVALAPALFTELPRKMLWFSVIYPFVGYWLIWGGSILAPVLVLLGFVLGYLAFRLTQPVGGELGAVIAAILVPLLWWLVAVGPINYNVTNAIGASQMASTITSYETQIAGLESEIADLQGQMDELERGSRARENLASLQSARKTVLSAAKRTLVGLQKLPEREEKYPKAQAKAEKLRAELPESVAKFEDINAASSNIPADDRRALQAALNAESAARTLKGQIDLAYAQAGRIGLPPVPSSDMGGFSLSLIIGITGIVCSLPLGILLALGRQSNLFIIRSLSVGFIEFIRGVPLITLLFVASTLLNYFLPKGTDFDKLLRVIIMVTLFASAYMAEVVRGGLAALPRGQYEGGDSLGLNYWQAQRLIILPQALKISIPNIVSTFIGLFKDTALVSIIALLDPIGLATSIRSDTDWNGIVWELYAFIGLMFFIFCFSMSRYSMYLERKLQTDHR
ncbi:amino acid ABC transporter permease [Halovulum sp. GXIMD14793]